ncbi:MAG: hypothetical protein ABIQ00_05865 [Chitinophagaceae bacterium]
MKQVSNAIKSFVLSAPLHHSIPQRKAFSKYLSLLFLAGITLFISSCQKDEMQGSSQKQNLLTSSQKQKDKTKCVPFKADFVTRGEIITEPQPGIPLLNHITGTGNGTHIGKATFDAYIEVDVFAPSPQIARGKFIITAASGDQIFLNTTGIGVGPDADGNFRITLSGTITGGTGRFAGATGNLTGVATDNEINPNGTTSFEGTICY